MPRSACMPRATPTARSARTARVNGEDYPAGQALAEYVGTWPQRGFEFRKQLVIAHLYDGEPD